MEVLAFLDSYKGILGGFSIAIATIIAVFISSWSNKRSAFNAARHRHSSFVSAIASELLDTIHTCEDLYAHLDAKKIRVHRVRAYLNFEFNAYNSVFDQIGDLGASLSFMVVDIYGDIKKLRNALLSLEIQEIEDDREQLLEDIQHIVVKGLSLTIALQLYGDYLNGPKYMRAIEEQRSIWLKQTLEDFCKYVAKVDDSLDFVAIEEKVDIPFLSRFKDVEDRRKARAMLRNFRQIHKDAKYTKPWKAQLFYSALALKLKNALTHFLQIEPQEYDLMIEKSYRKHLGIKEVS